jgi:FixJ family two-component response regulator
MQAMRAGAVKFLAKPFDGAILLEAARVALDSGMQARLNQWRTIP